MVKFTSKLFSLSLLIASGFLIFLSSCSSESKVYQGTIEFEVSYPYFTPKGFMANLLPEKMVMKFKGNKYKSEVKRGKAFSSAFIVDCDAKTLTTLFQFGNRRKFSTMDEARTLKQVEEKFTLPEYMHTNEGDSIAGFLCRKSIALFNNTLGQPEATLYYTDAIGIENPNWCLPYHEIKGVFLIYEIEQFGIRMRFTAKKFTDEAIDDKEFEVPANYKSVPVDELQKEMEDMFGTIVD